MIRDGPKRKRRQRVPIQASNIEELTGLCTEDIPSPSQLEDASFNREFGVVRDNLYQEGWYDCTCDAKCESVMR